MPVLTHSLCFESTSHSRPDTPVCMCSPSAHTRPVRPADRHCWPFAECPKLSAVCSNILWMSVYGRAVCKLTVLSSEGSKRIQNNTTLSGYNSSEYQDYAVMVCDPVHFGTRVQTLGRHLQPSPLWYPEEGGSCFPLIHPTCLPYP